MTRAHWRRCPKAFWIQVWERYHCRPACPTCHGTGRIRVKESRAIHRTNTNSFPSEDTEAFNKIDDHTDNEIW